MRRELLQGILWTLLLHTPPAAPELLELPGEESLLRHPSVRVKLDDPHLPHLLREMWLMLERSGGDGLAAVQIGRPLRLVLLKRENGIQVLVNPRIIARSRGQIRTWDGCLSIPAGFARISRYRWLEVSWLSADGQHHRERFAGRAAAVLEHELEHLSGGLFTDHLPSGTPLLPRDCFAELELETALECEDEGLGNQACADRHEAVWRRWLEGEVPCQSGRVQGVTRTSSPSPRMRSP